MAAKKKTNFVSPSPKDVAISITKFEDLCEGDAFILWDKLMIKCDEEHQSALEFYGDGNIGMDYDLCDEVVIPVKITGVTWEK